MRSVAFVVEIEVNVSVYVVQLADVLIVVLKIVVASSVEKRVTVTGASLPLSTTLIV